MTIKILGATWFTLWDGQCLGLVVTNNGFEDKAYIGLGAGLDEEADKLEIAERGAKFPDIDAAKSAVGMGEMHRKAINAALGVDNE